MTVPATLSGAIAVQYQDAEGDWITLATGDAGSLLRTRRLASPPRVTVTAQKWRIVRLGTTDLGSAHVRIGKVAFWRETEVLSDHRRWSFDFDAAEQRYGLVATDGNVEVYRRGERVASIPSPYAHDQVRSVRRTQSRDTLLAFLQSVAPTRFGRQGGHTEWDSRFQVFENVPTYDYNGDKVGGVNEVQQLTFVQYGAGDTFTLTVEDETTGTISYNTNMATLAASVAAALNALNNVGAGGVAVVSPADKTLTITFQNQAGATDWPEIATGTISSADEGLIRVATVTQGKPGGEPVMSDARGWPACGVFYGQRLWMGGLASRRQTLIGSRIGFFFDLKTGTDKGVDVDLDTDESTDILAMYPGSRLQIFASSNLFFGRALTAPPDVPRTARDGIEPGTPVLDLDGEAVFILAGGATIARTVYSDAQERFLVEPLTAFHSHLASGVIGGGMRRRRSIEEPNLGLFVRSDGTATVMSALLDQEVLGFAPWTTDGAFTEAGGELAGDLYVCTRRTSHDGTESHRLERVSERHLLDASVRLDGPGTVIDNLEHLEGRTVALYVDGADAGDAVVTDGLVTLPYPALRSREAGLLFETRGRILPIPLQQDPRAGASMHARSGELAFRLGPTASLRAGMAGKRLWPVPLKRRPGALLDAGPGEDAFTGWTRVFPLSGFQADAQIEWVQERPGPLEIQEIVVTVGS